MCKETMCVSHKKNEYWRHLLTDIELGQIFIIVEAKIKKTIDGRKKKTCTVRSMNKLLALGVFG